MKWLKDAKTATPSYIASVCAGVVIGHTICVPLHHHSPIEIYKRASQSVVTISAMEFHKDPFSPNTLVESRGSLGTGFTFKSKNNKKYIITNSHVVENSFNVKVTTFDKKEIISNIMFNDPVHDIAILDVTEDVESNATLKKCDVAVESGMPVLAIGNPFGFDHSVTSGIVSGTGRAIDSNGDKVPLVNLIQTDAPINPGNSGGPLIDASNGCVLGMNTLIMSPTGANVGLGFAVPISDVEHALTSLENSDADTKHLHKGVQLGVTVLPDTYAEMLNIEGVIIANVLQGGLCDSLGLVGTYRDQFGRPFVGDIIVGINDESIKKKSDLYKVLAMLKHEDTIQIHVLTKDGPRSYVAVAR